MTHTFSPDVIELNPHLFKKKHQPATKQSTKPPTEWPSERHFQAAVVAECDRRAVLEPEYGLIFAVPNGQYRKGQMMEPGLRSGIPDLLLPVVRDAAGLFLELKVKDGKPSRAQLDMIHRLRMQGYRVEIIWDSLDEVMSVIESYLRGDE